MGQGTIDYRPIFQQASRTQRIQHAFVEQEAFDMPWQQSIKIDADYLQHLKVRAQSKITLCSMGA